MKRILKTILFCALLLAVPALLATASALSPCPETQRTADAVENARPSDTTRNEPTPAAAEQETPAAEQETPAAEQETSAAEDPPCVHVWVPEKTTSEVETAENPHGTADFRCSRCGQTKSAPRCAGEVFADMPPEGNWAHDPIDWAYFNGITNGKTENSFAPKAGCTRAEAMTFLWNCAGRPEPAGTTTSFTDLKQSAYYYKAVLWAVENGITTGKTETSFAPKAACTRAEILTFLWRCSGEPEANGVTNPFSDVKPSAYYHRAVLWAVEKGVTTGKSAASFAPSATCTRAEVMTFLYKGSRLPDPEALWTQIFPLYYGETQFVSYALCRGNRVYVDRAIVERYFGAPTGETAWPILEKYGRAYISLADAANQLRIGVLFRRADTSVHLYPIADDPWTVLSGSGTEKTACIRLEDLMADYGLNKRFTHSHLIRVRFFSDYLAAKTDAFYVAWIPCYVNPPEHVENNIAVNYNFYNADFVLTLDSMILDGGRIGLHGYTHQDHDSVSAEGYEFGPANEMTEDEILERFRLAEQTAEALGYAWHFFEFPHYAATALQRETAEKHFDVVYQQYPDAAKKGQIETRTIGDHSCRWVPTPGDYVNGAGDRDRFCGALETCREKGYFMSFFFHPNVDTASMKYVIENDVMRCVYDQNGKNVLPEVIRLLTEWGYRLGPF